MLLLHLVILSVFDHTKQRIGIESALSSPVLCLPSAFQKFINVFVSLFCFVFLGVCFGHECASFLGSKCQIWIIISVYAIVLFSVCEHFLLSGLSLFLTAFVSLCCLCVWCVSREESCPGKEREEKCQQEQRTNSISQETITSYNNKLTEGRTKEENRRDRSGEKRCRSEHKSREY